MQACCWVIASEQNLKRKWTEPSITTHICRHLSTADMCNKAATIESWFINMKRTKTQISSSLSSFCVCSTAGDISEGCKCCFSRVSAAEVVFNHRKHDHIRLEQDENPSVSSQTTRPGSTQTAAGLHPRSLWTQKGCCKVPASCEAVRGETNAWKNTQKLAANVFVTGSPLTYK